MKDADDVILIWEPRAKQMYDAMLKKVPVWLRETAQKKMDKFLLHRQVHQGVTVLQEKDLVDAFFDQTPFGFHGLMKSDMESLKIDYRQYGYSA